MISKFITIEAFEVMVTDLVQHVSVFEFQRQVRPTLSDKVSPALYRTVFKISEAVRIAREVAQERGIQDPWALLQTKSEKEPEER